MHPPKERIWCLRQSDSEAVNGLSEGLGIPSHHAGLLAARGILTPGEAEQFLFPALSGLSDPFLFKGMAEAVERLVAARQKGEIVCIHGDYDVDGVTAVALLISFLNAVGIAAVYVIPLRLEEGYGLSTDGVEEALRLGARLLITVDCGISSVAEADYCSSRGLDLIITDHHTPGDILPAALAVINPLQPGCEAPFKQLAGVGIAFKLVMALRSRLREHGCFAANGEPNLRAYLDLVALGTIADLVPLCGENRLIAHFGLKEMSASSRTGIRALKNVSGVSGEVSCVDVGFRLAPRLNAAGRLDDAKRGVELLLTTDPENAALIAAELDGANSERREIERAILSEALLILASDPLFSERTSIVLASEKWHPGVIGIVASRLVDSYYRPVILIAIQDGVGKGSGRSIPPFHLYKALQACSDSLIKFGGHRQAAGLAILEQNIDSFRDCFDTVARQNISADELVPQLWIDVQLPPQDISRELIDFIERLKPFGMGNPEPVFLMKGARVLSSHILKESHLKLRLLAGDQEFEALGFGLAGKQIGNGLVDIVFVPEINRWNGRERLQLRLKDFRMQGVDCGAI